MQIVTRTLSWAIAATVGVSMAFLGISAGIISVSMLYDQYDPVILSRVASDTFVFAVGMLVAVACLQFFSSAWKGWSPLYYALFGFFSALFTVVLRYWIMVSW